jgi:hypothetical protein
MTTRGAFAALHAHDGCDGGGKMLCHTIGA